MLRIRGIAATGDPNRYDVRFEDEVGEEVTTLFTVSVGADGDVDGATPDPDVFWSGEATSTAADTRMIVGAVTAFHRARHPLTSGQGQRPRT